MKVVESGHNGQTWVMTDYYCPKCTANSIWKTELYNFYIGYTHICLSCSSCFIIELLNTKAEDKRGLLRGEEL